jgi:cytochrome P450
MTYTSQQIPNTAQGGDVAFSRSSESNEDSKNNQQHTATSTGTSYTYQALNLLDRGMLRHIYPANKENPFPHSVYMGGDPYWGKLWDLFSNDSGGLDKMIEQAATQVDANATGIAWWRFGPKKTAALVTKPADIKMIIESNIDNLYFHDSTGSFALFFGPQSIFNSPHKSEQWSHARQRFKTALLDEVALRDDVKDMQDIISQYMQQITSSKDNTITNLEEFASSITMEMISKLKLGIEKIPENTKKKISQVISDATIELSNPWNQTASQYIPFYSLFSKSKLNHLLKDGYQILREEVIKPNSSGILKTKNWLNPTPEKEPKPDLMSQNIVYDITQFLVAGHETTAKLVLLSLMLLGDSRHQEILSKLRAEIHTIDLPPEQWTRDHLAKLPYMDALLQEVLRLYPPIPDMIFKVRNDFTIMSGNLQADDIIIISPRVTHRSKAIWGEDADEFKPERFFETRYGAYQHFPFGFMPRMCVGRLFSLQEAKLILARVVTQFDLQLDSKLHHPFPFHQVFTLRLELENVMMRFTPNASSKQEVKYDDEKKYRIGLS